MEEVPKREVVACDQGAEGEERGRKDDVGPREIIRETDAEIRLADVANQHEDTGKKADISGDIGKAGIAAADFRTGLPLDDPGDELGRKKRTNEIADQDDENVLDGHGFRFLPSV